MQVELNKVFGQSDNKCIQLDNKCIQLENKCIQLDNKCIHLDNKCIQLDNKCIQLDNKCIQLDNKCIQLDKTLTSCCCLFKKWGPCNGNAEDSLLVGCDAVPRGVWFQTSRKPEMPHLQRLALNMKTTDLSKRRKLHTQRLRLKFSNIFL